MNWAAFRKSLWYHTKLVLVAFIAAYLVLIPMGVIPAMIAASPYTGLEFIVRWTAAQVIIMGILTFGLSLASLIR